MKQISKKDFEKLNHHKQVLFACFCAEQVLSLVREQDRSVCLRAIQTAYLFLENKATQEECRAASAAAYAAADSSKESLFEAQWDFYDQLLNSDKYFEEIMLEKHDG